MNPDAESETLRTFVAVEISEAAALRAGEIAARLRESDNGRVKWVDPRNFHLTIKFLGATRRTDLLLLSEALRDLGSRAAPFDLELTGVGALPSLRRPQVIWLGVASGGEALAALAGAAEQICAGLGWAREEKLYHAHLTLGRMRQRREGAKRGARGARPPAAPGDMTRLTQALEAETVAAAGATFVDRLVLLESQLHPRGPIYTVLDSFPLGQPGGE